jgi:23S rRNA pseudouridine1911/1915/1917 synthase
MCGRRIELVADDGGIRVDKFLAEQVADLSRSAIQRLIDTAQVVVNGEPVKASYRVRPGDLIVACVPQPEPLEPVAEAIPLGIVYEDQDLIVVNKPAGMVIHPAPGHRSGTLVNALLALYPDLAATGGVAADARPGIVHRLDRDTSGLILVAKNEQIRRALQRQFKARRCTRCT